MLFNTPAAQEVYRRIVPDLSLVLSKINSLDFEGAAKDLHNTRTIIEQTKAGLSDKDTDDVYNELFVLENLFNLLNQYLEFWRKIYEGKLSKSWDPLQNFQSVLRMIYRFLLPPRPRFLSHIERQSAEIEKLYPYTVFASIGVAVEYSECSICGKDMNSFDCEHIKGELYRGEFAYAIVKGMKADHVAFVTNPEDKRCVICIDESAPGFYPVEYLHQLVSERRLAPLEFSHIEEKKIAIPKETALAGRNDPCPCGSGKKYKKCCIDQQYVEKDHMDIIVEKTRMEELMIVTQ